MKIGKEFRWEMGHRLPEHFDKCKNIHGHSYRMILEVDGDVDGNGMVIDFYNLREIVDPVIEKLDHAFLVYEGDEEVIKFLKKMKAKSVIVNFQSTVENICKYFISEIRKTKLPRNIHKVTVRIYETENEYAETAIHIN